MEKTPLIKEVKKGSQTIDLRSTECRPRRATEPARRRAEDAPCGTDA